MERQKHVSDQIASLQLATVKAEQSMDRRLDGMNEIREAMREADNLKATKTELGVLRDEMDRRFDEILDPKTGIYAQLGKNTSGLRNWAIALLTAVLLLILGLIAHVAATGGKFL